MADVVKFRDERIVGSAERAGEVAFGAPRDIDATDSVGRHAEAIVGAVATELVSPQEIAYRVVFFYECFDSPGARFVASVEGAETAIGVTRDVDIAETVGRDDRGVDVATCAECFGPRHGAGRIVLAKICSRTAAAGRVDIAKPVGRYAQA